MFSIPCSVSPGQVPLPRSIHHFGQRFKRIADVFDRGKDLSFGAAPAHLYIGELSVLHRASDQNERFLPCVALFGVRGERVAQLNLLVFLERDHLRSQPSIPKTILALPVISVRCSTPRRCSSLKLEKIDQVRLQPERRKCPFPPLDDLAEHSLFETVDLRRRVKFPPLLRPQMNRSLLQILLSDLAALRESGPRILRLDHQTFWAKRPLREAALSFVRASRTSLKFSLACSIVG
jgi:hypothetical protein